MILDHLNKILIKVVMLHKLNLLMMNLILAPKGHPPNLEVTLDPELTTGQICS